MLYRMTTIVNENLNDNFFKYFYKFKGCTFFYKFKKKLLPGFSNFPKPIVLLLIDPASLTALSNKKYIYLTNTPKITHTNNNNFQFSYWERKYLQIGKKNRSVFYANYEIMKKHKQYLFFNLQPMHTKFFVDGKKAN